MPSFFSLSSMRLKHEMYTLSESVMTHLHINHRLTWIALVWPEVSVPAAHQGSALLPPPAWCKSSHSLSGHMPWHTHCSCGTHATCTFTATILIDHLAGCIAYPSNREVMRGWTSENTLSCESLGPYTLQEVSVNMCNTKSIDIQWQKWRTYQIHTVSLKGLVQTQKHGPAALQLFPWWEIYIAHTVGLPWRKEASFVHRSNGPSTRLRIFSTTNTQTGYMIFMQLSH